MSLNIEKYAITTQTYGIPLICSMKRYSRSSNNPNRETPGIILLLGHGAGFFKETWEPTVEDLFRLDDNGLIREAWALDCQNHGESCTLNEDILSRKPGVMTIWDYADAFATLVKSGLLDPHKKGHQIVLCGHSAGAVGVYASKLCPPDPRLNASDRTLSTSFFTPPSRSPFSMVILVDPPMWSKDKDGQSSDLYKMVELMTPIRRDVWKSFEAAIEWMKTSLPCESWDQRVFDVYTKFGLRTLPTAFYPDKPSGVTLTTHRKEENIAFTGIRFIHDAVNQLNLICEYVPVHLIYGGTNDMFERDVQDSLINPQEGRTFGSITRLEGAGHLVVQEAPTKLASTILDMLGGKNAGRPSSSKL